MDVSHSSVTVRKAAQQAVISCTGEPTLQQIKENNQTIKTYADNALKKANINK